MLTECRARPASCPHVLVLSLGTHVLTTPQPSFDACLLAEVAGIERAAAVLQQLAAVGVRVFWKLSEPENYEHMMDIASSVNFAHLIYNALITDRLEQVAPSVRLWSSVLPPVANYIVRCRLDEAWRRQPKESPLWNCRDHLHYGDVVQDQYRNVLQRYLCAQM
ncbi:uncharacterized protein LOC119112936 [Pollicipes pollicipes]|nr:uncharacterized protein LOC119104077 [Pollicipes pollicipes]XP_037093132.1 uncharacterized protein LOC119112936 [Pollicipes pollicipes]